MEIICVGPLEPALGNNQLHKDAWCEGQRLRYDASRRELVWSHGTCNVDKRIGLNKPPTMQSPIFAKFDGELCACVFVDPARILVCSEHGSEWEVSLPFSAKQMWRTPGNGLLVERPPHPNLVGEPFLFSISHPLEEPKPVEFSVGQIRKLQQMVWVSETDTAPPLLLTFSINERVHTLWSITTISAQQRREIAQVDEDEIHSEVVLTHMRRIEEWNFKLHRTFLCHDLDKNWFLCALAQNKMWGFALNNGEMFEINDVLDALPVSHSTEHGVVDVLVLHSNNKMDLYRAKHLLCPITFTSSQRIVATLNGQDASGGGFDLVFAGDGMRSRVVLNGHVSNQACAYVLRAAKEADSEFGLRVFLNIVAMRRNGGGVVDEWDALLCLFDHLLVASGGISTVPPPTKEEESWFDLLMRSSVHAKCKENGLFDDVEMPTLASKRIPAVACDPFPVSQQTWKQFFSILHLAYQDLKLNVLVAQLILPVGELLAGLAQALLSSSHSAAYRDMYRRDLPICIPVYFSSALPTAVDVAFPPPDIIDSLRHIIISTNGNNENNVEWKWTAQKYIQVFTKLMDGGSTCAAVEEIVKQGLTLRDIDTLPFGIQIILRETLHSVRESPPANMSLEMAVLIGRRDSYFSNNPHLLLPVQQQLLTAKLDDAENSEFKVLQAATKFRFAQDHRIKDVFTMLNGAKLPSVQCERKPGMSDHDLIKVQQVKLHRLISTSLASAVGRGALLLFTRACAGINSAAAGQSDHQPIASSIPSLAKSGLVPPQNVSLALDEHHQFNYSWPAFHNGAAAALSRPSYHSTHRNGNVGALAHRDLTRSWILFNKPKPTGKNDVTNAMDTHAGVLLAWGLNKDLGFLSLADTYEHLEQPHELTSIALMLGLGCAKAGTCDVNARKTLTLHVPSLFPAEFNEIDVVPITVQCAAICGLGMLYRGTCNRLMCEFLLDEMSQSFPISDASVEYQASYVLSCGLALGNVALALGSVNGGLAGLADLEIEDRLHLLIAGGPAMLDHQQQYSPSSSQAFDMNDLFSHASAAGSGGGSGSVGRQHASGAGSAMDPRCSRVLEGNHVNTDLTAPGATMALGMIYLKSNDASVANRLSAPSTRFLLENIRPDLLLFRTWAKALVLWDKVEPTGQWIEAQVPQVLQQQQEVEDDVQDAKYFAQVRTYIMAGAVLGLGFRFAGSANEQAKECLLQVFSQSLLRPNGILLCCICTSLGLVMAGTGDLDCLKAIRLFRRTRLCCSHFGISQLTSQSMGFLFLGGGRRSFSTSNESIAALVHSVFPRMCSTADDNTQYLQAMRHLYVLASESRVVETFDLDTGAQCFTPLVVTLKREEKAKFASLCSVPSFGDFTAPGSVPLQANQIQLVAPALLPPLHTVESISVVSPRYWPLTVHGFTPRLVVRLRADQLSYEKDAQGYSCLQARPRPRAVGDLLGTLRDFSIKSPFVLAFVKHAPISFEQLYQCMLADSLDALPCLLEIGLLKHKTISALEAEQACLLRQYYCYSKQPRRKRLVPETQLLLHTQLDSAKLKQYVTKGQVENDMGFYAALNLKGIPKWGVLSAQCFTLTELSSEAAVEILACI